ncbi:MAG: TIGR03016 family PEP-CTERM system-associated outer membrane protein [Desulfuromonadaceae bacterium]|nr:TIGR03016 family PEP-CTERM system-associated outer membrane protein [Desulfuromonadaceae bacterium]
MKSRILLPAFLSCLLLGFFATHSLAKIKIHPSITLQEEYTDNLYLTDKDEEEDWITTVEPGISLNYDGSLVDLTIGYSLRYQFYKNNSDDNQTSFEGIQRADVTTTLFRGNPFTVGVSGTISRETLDERENNTDENELVNKSTVYQLSVTPRYRLQLGESFSLVFGYSYDRTDYVDPLGNDSEDHTGRLSLVKQLSTNTEISANYSYTVHQSEDDEEYDEQRYTLGLNQQLGPRTRISLEGGYSTVEFDTGLDDETTNWLVDLSYRLTAPLTLSLVYTQDFSVTATEGLTKTRDAGFVVAYAKESLTASVELFWKFSDYVRQLREDESYGSRFSLSVPLSRALTSNFNAEYEKAQYDDVTVEEVDRYSVGASVDYEFRRFLTSLGYRYRLKDSDDNDNDYANNTVTLSVSLRF